MACDAPSVNQNQIAELMRFVQRIDDAMIAIREDQIAPIHAIEAHIFAAAARRRDHAHHPVNHAVRLAAIDEAADHGVAQAVIARHRARFAEE